LQSRVTRALALMSAAVTFASAATISYTTPLPAQSWPVSQLGTLNLFDSNLGTLTAVKLTLDVNTTAEIDITNLTGVSQNFTNATAKVTMQLNAPSSVSIQLVDYLAASQPSGVAPAGNSVFPAAPTNTSVSLNIPTIDWSAYQLPGGGTFN